MSRDILNLIAGRRSTRRFKKAPVPEALIERLIEAARWAPSGLNNQPWGFKIITNKEEKDALSRFTESGCVIKSAALVIAFFLDKRRSYNRVKDLMAIGASVQNMLLEAASLELATCWLGEILNKKPQASRFLKAGKALEFLGVVAVGHPLIKRRKMGVRRPMASLIVR